MKLLEQLVDIALKDEKTNIILLDAIISDGKNLSRMATIAEIQAIKEHSKCFKTSLDIEIELYYKQAV